MTIATKRVYDDAAHGDGYRVLVDRLWPRGVSKERAHVDVWLRDVGPSDELRRWFHHEARLFEEFADRYRAELATNPAVETLRGIVRSHDVVTLVYSARDAEHNQAVVLRDYLSD
ncbi:protein of unknown function DUF488 [Beutenbergia cavernae DSM 12333]|uniref:Uroporphyrin-III C-methyltransferase n=1 Tax=Beutenbergia cavernae (strain ATCC BAA-8 / DSM 12333 / CCUG 43141 / JCM 11478 / NBRC 16432 / NCIMB 13614 / HKI 0122) TaxID=471853 RepID=C5BX28_BEUC1|nr:DUF488 family protein [Beutenbergia cavernae]ACQ78703.1 protein of unknown function DUF488 [Beutenbergia cavernae DSM 12333]